MSTADPRDFVTVYTGSHTRVVVLEGLLEAEGIMSFVPDRMLKTADPFITGANPLDLHLQVPTPDVAAAQELIAREFPVPAPPASRLVRIRWGLFALIMLLPLAIMLVLDTLSSIRS